MALVAFLSKSFHVCILMLRVRFHPTFDRKGDVSKERPLWPVGIRKAMSFSFLSTATNIMSLGAPRNCSAAALFFIFLKTRSSVDLSPQRRSQLYFTVVKISLSDPFSFSTLKSGYSSQQDLPSLLRRRFHFGLHSFLAVSRDFASLKRSCVSSQSVLRYFSQCTR